MTCLLAATYVSTKKQRADIARYLEGLGKERL